jgi:hypothetical protein
MEIVYELWCANRAGVAAPATVALHSTNKALAVTLEYRDSRCLVKLISLTLAALTDPGTAHHKGPVLKFPFGIFLILFTDKSRNLNHRI